MGTSVLYKGDKLIVYITDEMKKDLESRNDSILIKFSNRVKYLANDGFIENDQYFKHLKGVGCANLWELKILSNQLRYFVYYDFNKRDKIVIFDMILKKSNRINQSIYRNICKKMKNFGYDL